MNIVMTGSGGFVEIQGTAEGAPFSREMMDQMSDLAADGIKELIQLQKNVLK
jgi:ribonuclease PH